ncbi:hypothetical protein C8E00_1149 [Chromohalobacter marismortui]|uniref:Uncharacterized protein n=1 Tax=Chromohalobacter marismortui TaxID=42055 RepID=A0A4R7NDF9_9GAMM|nr:hypothetical protein [Halomonadaceae]TDU18081.1 hypothetical protein C8E00_1149 [Chromohalobacter marismortui]|tara:strand:+ start:4229 stop:4600 length:372 start_codon:yes stop_codon:yes gene_type:complete
MPPILTDTFGGLSRHYYLRQLAFGGGLSALVYFAATQGGGDSVPLAVIPLLALNALLYPYSRFVYEQIIGFVMGDNVFYIPLIIMLPVKLFTIVMCWGWAIFIAPVGLLYLYFHHRKARRQTS